MTNTIHIPLELCPNMDGFYTSLLNKLIEIHGLSVDGWDYDYESDPNRNIYLRSDEGHEFQCRLWNMFDIEEPKEIIVVEYSLMYRNNFLDQEYFDVPPLDDAPLEAYDTSRYPF